MKPAALYPDIPQTAPRAPVKRNPAFFTRWRPNRGFSGGIVISALFLPILLVGCSYYRLGTTLPHHLRTVYVPTFQNSTNEPGIEIDITSAVIERLQTDGNLRPVSEGEADAVLEGRIVGWDRRVLAYTGASGDVVDEYRLLIVAEITFKDLRTSKVLVPGEQVAGKTDFFVEGSLTDSENEARPDAYKDLARQVVDVVVSVW